MSLNIDYYQFKVSIKTGEVKVRVEVEKLTELDKNIIKIGFCLSFGYKKRRHLEIYVRINHHRSS